MVPFNRRKNDLAGRNDFWDIDTAFENFFDNSLLGTFFAGNYPIKADIKDNDKEYVIEAEIPGAKKEDIKLNLIDGTLTISVEHDEVKNDERENYIRKERRYGSCSRSFYVENVKQEDAAAKYDNGVLTVTLPKSGETKPKGHRIDIQ
jgi:HSP20 family protein